MDISAGSLKPEFHLLMSGNVEKTLEYCPMTILVKDVHSLMDKIKVTLVLYVMS